MLACTNGNGTEPDGKVDVTVKIETVITKADVGAVPTAYQTKIQKAYAYVVDFNGKVLASGLFESAEITGGKTFSDLTSEVTDVIVIANWPSTFDPTSIANGSLLQNIELMMSNLLPAYDDSGEEDKDTHGVKYAALYNAAAATIDKTTDTANWTAAINIAPVVTRFEIAEISGTAEISDTETYSGLLSYTLSGVYMNNVYTSVKLGANTIFATGATKLDEAFDETTTFPVAGRTAWSCDVFADEYEAGLTYGPTNGVWAYHVAPVDASTDATKTPQIVLHLTDVVFGTSAADSQASDFDNLYVPIVGFKDNSGAITEFKRGNVYRIESLEFNRTHTKTDTDPSEITLTATVTVLGWEINTVNPIF